ncbi:MAG: GNAT family N-acetyltransferase [bacterium]
MHQEPLRTLLSIIRDLGSISLYPPYSPGLPLKGERIVLRRFLPEDTEKRQRWAKYHDPYLQRYNFPRRKPKQNRTSFIRLSDRIRIAVVNMDGELIGYASLKSGIAEPIASELGICFAADQIGKGYGWETLLLLLPWTISTLHLQSIYLEVDVINTSAVHLYQKSGFCVRQEFWRKEDDYNLRKHWVQIPFASFGVRWRGNQLEVLTWVMEWKPYVL